MGWGDWWHELLARTVRQAGSLFYPFLADGSQAPLVASHQCKIQWQQAAPGAPVLAETREGPFLPVWRTAVEGKVGWNSLRFILQRISLGCVLGSPVGRILYSSPTPHFKGDHEDYPYKERTQARESHSSLPCSRAGESLVLFAVGR